MGACCSAENNPSTALPNEEDLTCPGQFENDRSSSRISSVTVASNPQSRGEILESPNLKTFCFSDLKEATRNFHDDNKLGQGNFGPVFKGWIDEQSLKAAQPEAGMAVAVKMLNLKGCQGLAELVDEIKFLGRLCHPNLVKLIGYCSEGERLLVYEFMPMGSLEKHIFRSDSSFQPFSWNRRMKIALGAAQCLAFLHDAHVIYRDLKSSDVLLDLNYNAKLSDFGLARDAPTDGRTHVSTRALGTEGYSAPEFMGTGHLTTKSDVYSFGVVFLELLSGMPALDKNRPQEKQRLVEWARPHLSSTRNSFQVLDDSIRNEAKNKHHDMQKAFKLAVKCLSTDPRLRPDMKDVVRDLEQLYDPNEK